MTTSTSYIVFLTGPLSSPEKIQEIARLPHPPAVRPVDEEEADDTNYEAEDQDVGRVTQCCLVNRQARDSLVDWARATDEHIHPIIPIIPTEPASTVKALRTAYPTPYFLYGTSSSPAFLANLFGHDRSPDLPNASLRGYRIKRWEGNQALVHGSGHDVVDGVIYMATSEAEVEKIAEWLGFAYEATPCDIILTSGEIFRGNVFIYWWEPYELEEPELRSS